MRTLRYAVLLNDIATAQIEPTPENHGNHSVLTVAVGSPLVQLLTRICGVVLHSRKVRRRRSSTNVRPTAGTPPRRWHVRDARTSVTSGVVVAGGPMTDLTRRERSLSYRPRPRSDMTIGAFCLSDVRRNKSKGAENHRTRYKWWH